MNKPTTMRLCPGCHSIQKCGTICGICGCPVPFPDEDVKELKKENSNETKTTDVS